MPRVNTAPATRRATAPGRAPSPNASPTPAPVARTDPRWLFAARVGLALDGNRAAILRPERRDALLATAAKLGLRPFDAALVIAAVQDRARRGLAPLGPELASTLALMPTPAGARRDPAQAQDALAAAVALCVGLTMAAALAAWLLA